MRRIVLLVCILLTACKKQPREEDPGPPPGPPKVGHSITKIPGGEGGGDHGSASAAEPAGEASDARTVGGNGTAAFRDDQGKVHGPGGPVYMGTGTTCDGAHDHCLRTGVWFSVANFVSGKLFRAVPVFELEGKWFTWRGDEETPAKAYRTEVAKGAVPAGTQVIVFTSEGSSGTWADSEYEAMVSSRWEAAVTETASSNGSVKIAGYGGTPLDTVRVIVETK